MAQIALLSSTSPSPLLLGSYSNIVVLEIEESFEQMTLDAGEDIDAGAPVRVNASGNFVRAAGTSASNAKAYGIATHKVKSGSPLTAVAKGVLSGFDFSSQAFNADIFVSDTTGTLADAAGTSSKVVGQVVPLTKASRSASYSKGLRVTL